MKDCPTQEQLSLHFDGELDNPEVGEHIVHCADCQSELQELQRLDDIVSSNLSAPSMVARPRRRLLGLAAASFILSFSFFLGQQLLKSPVAPQQKTYTMKIGDRKNYNISTNNDTILLSLEINGERKDFR